MDKVWIKLHSRWWLRKNLFYKNKAYYKNHEHYRECQVDDAFSKVSPPLQIDEIDKLSSRIFNVTEKDCEELSWCTRIVNIKDYPEYLV